MEHNNSIHTGRRTANLVLGHYSFGLCPCPWWSAVIFPFGQPLGSQCEEVIEETKLIFISEILTQTFSLGSCFFFYFKDSQKSDQSYTHELNPVCVVRQPNYQNTCWCTFLPPTVISWLYVWYCNLYCIVTFELQSFWRGRYVWNTGGGTCAMRM